MPNNSEILDLKAQARGFNELLNRIKQRKDEWSTDHNPLVGPLAASLEKLGQSMLDRREKLIAMVEDGQ